MLQVCRRRQRVLKYLGITGLLVLLVQLYVYQRATVPLSDKKIAQDPSLVDRIREGKDLRSLDINVKKFNDVWQIVNSTEEMYLFSAFYDDRPSLLTDPVIRVITVSEDQIEQRKAYCYLWFGESTDPFVEEADVLRLGIGGWRHGKHFRERLCTCKLRKADEIPKAVSIELGDANSNPPKPSTYLTIQHPEKPTIKQDFISCVSVTFWKIDPHRIVEWMELHKIWGVHKVTIYNSSIADESAKVFLHYQKEGFVDFRQAPQFLPDPGEMSILLTMIPVILDCLYRNMYKYNKVVVTDLDEMIVPRTTLNYKALLNEIDKQQPSDHKARAYVFRNDFFFMDPRMPEDKEMPDKLVTLRHRVRVQPCAPGNSVKSIIDPQACVVMHNHFCSVRTNGHDTDGNTVHVNIELGLNQHYKKCHLDKLTGPGECARRMEEQTKDDTMLRFKDQLMRNASRQFRVLELGTL
ncbi:unnamed protein product [Owenia fusiformis]|uniref:Glycosyltransferase family 92 protein n=1 Tax=Owenia fusiformis TaxID=6347 RepID=A0A8J1TGD6_OWEFU|nr:unnamed protein product [Owenia fusiformis]